MSAADDADVAPPVPVLRPAIRLALAIVALGIAAGVATWGLHPQGFVFYTPRDWCVASRMNPFSLGYSLVALVGMLGLGVAALVLALRSRRASQADPVPQDHRRAAIAGLAALAVFFSATLVPVVEAVLPMAPDPRCTRGA